MAVQLFEPTDPIEVKQICCLAYGQPGCRKTSMSQTAEKPFTFAFDQGVYRAFGRKTCGMFDTWNDVLAVCRDVYAIRAGHQVQNNDQRYMALVNYILDAKTIVLDTLGMCMDKMSEHIMRDNPKHGNRTGGLSLQGYGALANQFSQWIAPLKQYGQDLVMICHEASEKVGDDDYYHPAIVGKSYNTVMNVADMVGYMHFQDGRRVIDFNPSDRWMAKVPPCGFNKLVIPDFDKEPDFLAKLIAEAKASMGRISNESAVIAKEVNAWAAKLDPDTVNLKILNETILPPYIELGPGPVKTQVWKLMTDFASTFNCKFNKDTKKFEEKKGA